MKKKIIKLWGVGMIVVLMASLLIVGATPASAGTLAYTAVGVPGALFNQIAAGTDVALVRVAPNGDIFAADPANAAAVVGAPIYKSVDGGRTWGLVPVVIGTLATDVIADIQVSPSYETDGTVVVLLNTLAGNAVVYISNNYGVTYTTLGAMVVAGEVGTSLAISPLYNGGAGEIMVGTVDNAATFGDVYIWGQPGFTYVWNPQNLGGATGLEDVTAVAFSPNYAIDFTIIAVGSTAAATMVHTKVGANAWDATVGLGAVVPIATAGPLAITAPGTGAQDIISATLAFPSDFRASMWPIATTCYVAVRSGNANDKIYRVNVGGGATAIVAMDPNAAGFPAAGDDEVTSLAYAGTGLAGMLYIGYAGVLNPPFGYTAQVYRSSNAGTALPTFAAARPGPTGTVAAPGQLTYVALAADYTTSNRVYAGTIGANSALSISDDGGASFYQAGLIDTAVVAIDDFAAASATEMFLVTNDAAAGPESIWKSVDGGATWYRYGSVVTTTAGIIRLSPTYATDNFVLFGNVGSAAANNLMTSNDSGIHWTNATCPIAPVDIAVSDAFTYLVAGAGVQRTVNGGWTWQLFATATGAANDIEIDTATGHILVGLTAGGATLSINSNFTYVGQGVGMGGPTIVEFDSNYATNNAIYGADTTPGVAGVQRYTVGSPPGTAWAVIDLGATLLPADIISAPDGTLYASDFTAGGGMQRSLNPTAPVIPPVPSPLFEAVAGAAPPVGDGLPAGATLTVLSLVEGSNIVYAINPAGVPGPGIVTYTDTMTQAVPAVVSPAEGDVVLAAVAAVAIDPIPGVIFGAYQVQWNTRADWLGTGNILQFPGVINAVNLNTAGAALVPPPAVAVPAGVTVHYRVRATGPVFGPWSPTISFETQLTAGVINAPAILSPVRNGTGPGGYDAELNPTFSWGVIGAATNYEFQLATDAGMTNILVDASGPDALGNVLVYQLTEITLDYNTTYYWTVRATSATSETAWSAVIGFTTMVEPAAPPPPPVTVTDVPQPTVTVIIPTPPAPTTITLPPAVEGDEISPAYIWAIIIIGAVLVIAVIVLIVRTRRSV